MPIGKHKGIFYSLITLLLVVPILLFLITYQEAAGSRDELATLKIRGIETSNYANSISQDVPRIFAITSRRALISALNEIDINGTGLNDSQATIVELMYNASIKNISSTFMQGASLKDWASRMQGQGSRFGFITIINLTYLNVTPYDSFHLEFSMLLFVNATDIDGIVSIVRTYNESYILPLDGIEDVLYPINSGGFLKRYITRANKQINGNWLMDQAIIDENYTSSANGASFLDRMEGRSYLQPKYAGMSPRNIGLESFVNLQKISALGLPTRDNQTIIDYLYFNTSTFVGCTVTNSSFSWAKIGFPHNVTYNVTILPCG